MTASVSGGRLERVTCDKCGTAFCYELTRVGIGKASAPYFLFQGAATIRAESRAEDDLKKRLHTEAELVPCPKCFWVNEALVQKYRRRLYRKAPWVAAGVLALCFFIGPMLAINTTTWFGYESNVPRLLMLGSLVGGIVLAAGVMVVRRQLRLRIDPNLTHPRRPVLPPGTPPALIEEIDPRTGRTALRAVARPDDALPDAEWVTLRAGKLQFPRNCCVCLEPPRTLYQPPFTVNQTSSMPVPLCEACALRLFWRWWLLALAAIAVAVLVAAGVAAAIPGDAFAKWFVFIFIALFAALSGAAIVPNAICRPYRLKVVDADRGVIQFAAKNQLFTGMIAAAAMAAEKITPPPSPAAPRRRPPVQDVDRSPIPLD